MVTRLSGGLTPADGADPRTFPAIWNSAADEIDAKVLKDDEAGAPFIFWGEESASGGVIGQNLSLGNGDTTSELPLPASGKITALGLFLEVSGTTTTLQIVKNGTLAGSGYEISGSANRQVVTLASPLTFSAGDSVNLQFTVGGASPCVGSIFGYWT